MYCLLIAGRQSSKTSGSAQLREGGWAGGLEGTGLISIPHFPFLKGDLSWRHLSPAPVACTPLHPWPPWGPIRWTHICYHCPPFKLAPAGFSSPETRRPACTSFRIAFPVLATLYRGRHSINMWGSLSRKGSRPLHALPWLLGICLMVRKRIHSHKGC